MTKNITAAPVAQGEPVALRERIDAAQEYADAKLGVYTWGESSGSWREAFAHALLAATSPAPASQPVSEPSKAVQPLTDEQRTSLYGKARLLTEETWPHGKNFVDHVVDLVERAHGITGDSA